MKEVVTSIDIVVSKQIGDALYKGYSFDVGSNRKMFVLINRDSPYNTSIAYSEGSLIDGQILFTGHMHPICKSSENDKVPSWTRVSIITTTGSCQIVAKDDSGRDHNDAMHIFYENK